jgi:ABC-type nitrate/sulfonate/bicarbonate transport system substrate-binding protein
VEMLRHLGLEAGRDVQLVSTNDSPGGLAALMSGAVAATALRQPQDAVALKEGYRRIVSAPEVLEPVPDTAVVTHRLKLQEQSEQVRRVVRALFRATHFLVDRPDETTAVIQREFELEPAVARIVYDSVRAVYNLQGEASEESLQAAIKRALAAGEVRQSEFAPKDFVDWTLLREVRRELGR